VRALTLYHREGCHLCEAMERELLPLLAAHGWGLERVDVDGDPALAWPGAGASSAATASTATPSRRS